MSESGIFVGGFPENWQDTNLDFINRGFLRGLSEKRASSSFLRLNRAGELSAGGLWAAAVPTVMARGAVAGGGRRRGVHGEHGGALTGRGDGRRMAGDGEQKHRRRLMAVVVFWWLIGDDEGLRRCSTSTWTSWRPRLGPADNGGGESCCGGELAGSAPGGGCGTKLRSGRRRTVLGEVGQARARGFMGRGRGKCTWHGRLGSGRRLCGLPVMFAMDTVGGCGSDGPGAG
jgi:hypothetical protein